MSQTDCIDNPLPAFSTDYSQTSVPVEICRTIFDGVKDIPKFFFFSAAVTQPMNAQNPQMIFGSQNSDISFAALYQNRIVKQIIPFNSIEMSQSTVQIHFTCFQVFLQNYRPFKITRIDSQIEITKSAQMRIRIIKSRRPAFYQHRLDFVFFKMIPYIPESFFINSEKQ